MNYREIDVFREYRRIRAYPARRRTIRLRIVDRHYHAYAGVPVVLESSTFNLPFPPHLVMQQQNDEFKVVFLHQPFESLDTRIYGPLLPNLYGNHVVCTGNERFSNIDSFLDYFWMSDFYETRPAYWPSTDYLSSASYLIGSELLGIMEIFQRWSRMNHDEFAKFLKPVSRCGTRCVGGAMNYQQIDPKVLRNHPFGDLAEVREYPVCRRTIKFLTTDGHFRQGSPLPTIFGQHVFNLAFPSYLVLQSRYPSLEGDKYNYRIIFLREGFQSGRTRIYGPLLPNVGDNFRVCCGDLSFDNTDDFLSYFWMSEFYERVIVSAGRFYEYWESSFYLRTNPVTKGLAIEEIYGLLSTMNHEQLADFLGHCDYPMKTMSWP